MLCCWACDNSLKFMTEYRTNKIAQSLICALEDTSYKKLLCIPQNLLILVVFK